MVLNWRCGLWRNSNWEKEMAILEGIQIRNFRALKDITLGKTIYESNNPELPRLVAVIGANGVGKSSLLDALSFLGDCLKEGVEIACDKQHRGGFDQLRTKGVDGAIEFEIRYRESDRDRPINYTLHIGCDQLGRPIVVKERLRQRRKGQKNGQPFPFVDLTNGEGYAWSGESTATVEGNTYIPVKMTDHRVLAITTLGYVSDHPRIGLFRIFLSRWYLSYFVPQLAREPSMAGAEAHLDREGKNLDKYLQFIERAKPLEFKAMLQSVAKKIPGINNIKSVIGLSKQLFLEFYCDGYGDNPFYKQSMSDGTLKLLAYLLLMEDPDPAPFIGIEEPENGLHHQLLSILAKEFKTFASQERGPQVLVTTHSPNFVDALSPHEVWILDKGADGFTTLKLAADLPEVVALFDEGIPMGSLWFSNHFGIGSP
jgi:predicted ATPase